MAGRTALTPKALKTPYSDVSANDLDFAFAAADQANGNAFPFSGWEVILLQNSGASPATVTLASALDTYGRTKDIRTYTWQAKLADFGAKYEKASLLESMRNTTLRAFQWATVDEMGSPFLYLRRPRVYALAACKAAVAVMEANGTVSGTRRNDSFSFLFGHHQRGRSLMLDASFPTPRSK